MLGWRDGIRMLFVRVSPGNGPPACTAGRYERPASVRSAFSHGHTDDYSKSVCLLRQLFTLNSPPFLLLPHACSDPALPTGRRRVEASGRRSVNRISPFARNSGVSGYGVLSPRHRDRPTDCCADLRDRSVMSHEAVYAFSTQARRPNPAAANLDAETLGVIFLPPRYEAAPVPRAHGKPDDISQSNTNSYEETGMRSLAASGNGPARVTWRKLTNYGTYMMA